MALHHKTDENLYRLNRCNYKSMHFTMTYYKKTQPLVKKEQCGESGTENDNDFFFIEIDLYMISEF